MNKSENICLKYKCSWCCNPVKINSLKFIDSNLPFVKIEEILIPKDHPESIRLQVYQCLNFNPETGFCNDYLNRPDMCRNTKCSAFYIGNERMQERIIKKILAEKFIKIRTK